MRLRKFILLMLFANSICFGEAISDQNSVSDLNSDPIFIAVNKMRVNRNKINKILIDADPNTVLEAYPDTIIETETNIVKGFPNIFKVKLKGLGAVPGLTIFDERFDVAIIFRSKMKNKLFVINSRGLIIEESLKDESGKIIYTRERGLSQIVMSQKDNRAMLLDISSLSPVYSHSVNFSDIPPGDYTVYIILFDYSRTSCKVSNTTPVRIIEPTEIETKYLKSVKNDKKWSDILRTNLPISRTGLNNITPEARKQMEFHLLLSDILSSKLPVKDFPLETLQSMPVPDYLLSEKESLLFELKLISGKIKDDDAALKSFIEKHPELKWRIDDVKTNGGDFLFHKIFLEKWKPQRALETADANF